MLIKSSHLNGRCLFNECLPCCLDFGSALLGRVPEHMTPLMPGLPHLKFLELTLQPDCSGSFTFADMTAQSDIMKSRE